VKRPLRVALILAALSAGIGGFWIARDGAISLPWLASKTMQASVAQEIGPVLYYRDPDGKPFYAAESYHQNYLTLHPDSAYIVTYDLPKIANLAKVAPSLYRQSIKQQ